MASSEQGDVELRIASLRQALDEHSYRYYVLDDPSVDDSVYDGLMRELEGLGFDGVRTAEMNHDPFFPLLLAAEHSE
ncbi:MAG: hypothetical protein AAFX85_16350, partial [Pseudomonadota bacterium]